MKVRLFSDNTPVIDGISADVTLDIDMVTVDKNVLVSIVTDLLEASFEERSRARLLAEDIVDELGRECEFVRG